MTKLFIILELLWSAAVVFAGANGGGASGGSATFTNNLAGVIGGSPSATIFNSSGTNAIIAIAQANVTGGGGITNGSIGTVQQLNPSTYGNTVNNNYQAAATNAPKFSGQLGIEGMSGGRGNLYLGGIGASGSPAVGDWKYMIGFPQDISVVGDATNMNSSTDSGNTMVFKNGSPASWNNTGDSTWCMANMATNSPGGAWSVAKIGLSANGVPYVTDAVAFQFQLAPTNCAAVDLPGAGMTVMNQDVPYYAISQPGAGGNGADNGNYSALMVDWANANVGFPYLAAGAYLPSTNSWRWGLFQNLVTGDLTDTNCRNYIITQTGYISLGKVGNNNGNTLQGTFWQLGDNGSGNTAQGSFGSMSFNANSANAKGNDGVTGHYVVFQMAHDSGAYWSELWDDYSGNFGFYTAGTLSGGLQFTTTNIISTNLLVQGVLTLATNGYVADFSPPAAGQVKFACSNYDLYYVSPTKTNFIVAGH